MKKAFLRYPFLFLPACILLIVISSCSQKRKGEPRILVFTKTAAFHHSSIPDGAAAIIRMGQEKGFLVDTTSDATKFNEDTLKRYSAVVFLSTTGDVLNAAQQADFERYIQAGGGYLGIHAAADTEYDWPWYGKLVGAYFKSHPKQQDASLIIHKDPKFPVLDSLPNPWKRFDEWYNYRKAPDSTVHVLISLDESSYTGGENGKNHPIVWYHDYDGGRSFYIGIGHTTESYVEPNFLNLLWAGLRYVIGKNDVLDYNKATSLRKPDDDRFSKEFLAGGLDEPTELTVLPNLDVLIAERKGGIKFYNHLDSTIKEVAHLNVYSKALHVKGVNVETGLLGLHADPHYDKNNQVFVYYSPVDTSVDRLSRFTFKDGKFDLATEKVILEVKTDREICCHTGGSIAFDAHDNLYLSVGDNTTPFDEVNPATGKAYPINSHGFSPVDDRPGFFNFDDRRAAGNSNDLRGKILRIHVNDDGSYSIPEGNLFPKGTDKTRPEIYVMGNRNPYRISVDKHTGYVYWGDVGPDASHDSLETHGPRGYDEVGQARKSGNFGWPYFVGNNYAYHEYNYATGDPGPAFDPNHVVNNSRNNTGIKDLPPAMPAFIWYPYDASPDFPILGSGGRTAMAGPVYYVNDFPEKTRFPQYYDGKLFIYDWIRNWIMVVTMNKEGDLQTIEPFMPETEFVNISDMETGPDGRLYIVEYGKGWFAKNPDAALSVLSYNGGNRPPVAKIQVSPISGSLPLTVHLTADGTFDPDRDKMAYNWDFGNGDKTETDTPSVNYTYKQPGTYAVSVTASDGKGGSSQSPSQQIFAGNTIADVSIRIASGNPMFYFPGRKVDYEVDISDKEDGNSSNPGFDAGRAFVQLNYLQSPDQAALSKEGLERLTNTQAGKTMMMSLDCQSCHKVDGKSVGPSFIQVAARYEKNKQAVGLLSEKIIQGGSGNWGETAMPAHPKVTKEDAGEMVHWILSLAGSNHGNSMPLKGSFVPDQQFTLTPGGALILSASYSDKGSQGIQSLTGTGNLVLRSPDLSLAGVKTSPDVSEGEINGRHYKLATQNGSWIEFSQISLEGVRQMLINYGLPQDAVEGWNVELHLDAPTGTLLGKTNIGRNGKSMKLSTGDLSLNADGSAVSGLHDVYLTLSKAGPDQEGGVALLGVQLK